MAVSTGIQYINIDEFTKNVQIGEAEDYLVTGDGIFDTLMETATAHLISQYNANRIRKEDYANLYAHIYEVTLQAALQAWLQKPQSAAQVELLNAQTANTEQDTAVKVCQERLVCAEATHEAKKQANTEAQTANLAAQTSHEAKKELGTVAQTALINAQKATEDKRPALIECQTQLACAQAEAQDKQLDLLEKQIDVAQQQIEVTKQQAVSEKMKANLYRRQIEGFDEDYKQKLLKIMMDSWAVGFSVAKDSFQASGIPVTMQAATIKDLYNNYIVTDLDRHIYARTDSTTSGSGL